MILPLRRLSVLILSLIPVAGVIFLLSARVGPVPPLGELLDPLDGAFATARNTRYPAQSTLRLPGLGGNVTVIRDARAVPHIFAQSDEDAIRVFGFVCAQDRLFQMDFMRRVPAGRLAEAVGEAGLETDRFMRATGMELGTNRSAEYLRNEAGNALRAVEAFQDGVNAYITTLTSSDLPIEYRLLGFEPEPFVLEDAIRLLQFMAFDLTYRTDDAMYGILRDELGDSAFFQLYPRHAPLADPIIPADDSGIARSSVVGEGGATAARFAPRAAPNPLAEGFRHGKGSNNWAVHGDRSASGKPLLAGDVHLGLSLPSIWYEVHLVTPAMNVYGVTIPGAPLPVIGFNDHVAWTFTNTGADQIDHYLLELDDAKRRYLTPDGWEDFQFRPDTIRIKGGEPAIDTLRYSRWGPAELVGDHAVAIQWTAHQRSRTVQSLWDLVHATSAEEVDEALRLWDSPMQNVLFADDSSIGIRVAGLLPIRRGGHGMGLSRGEDGYFDWTGFVPFEEMPQSVNPAQQYLASANQEPVDSSYPYYYLGYDWRDVFRSRRINELLQHGVHDVEDFQRYQSDVHVVQHGLMSPLLDTLSGLSDEAASIRDLIVNWNATANLDVLEALAFDELMLSLGQLAWDEPIFAGGAAHRTTEVIIAGMRNGRTMTGQVPAPSVISLLHLLSAEPNLPWWDMQATHLVEDASGLLRSALEATADTMRVRYGTDREQWRWGDHHELMIPHVTRSPALSAFWRGPFPYPGFAATLSPAGDRLTTHSAAWRMIVDFSTMPPTGYGVLPGGQSGNPFSEYYALDIQRYLSFELNELQKPRSADDFDPGDVLSRTHFIPGP